MSRRRNNSSDIPRGEIVGLGVGYSFNKPKNGLCGSEYLLSSVWSKRKDMVIKEPLMNGSNEAAVRILPSKYS
jgi:hypothetical protein